MITLKEAMKMVDTLGIKTPEECTGFLKGIFFSMKMDGLFEEEEEEEKKEKETAGKPVYRSSYNAPYRKHKNNTLLGETTIVLGDYTYEDDVKATYEYLEILIEDYGKATMYDMKEEFGIPTCYTDRKRGWKSLPDWDSYKDKGFGVDSKGDCVSFQFPKPIDLD